MKQSQRTKRMTISLPVEVAEGIAKAAKRQSRSVSNYLLTLAQNDLAPAPTATARSRKVVA